METLARPLGDGNVLDSPELLTQIFNFLTFSELKDIRLVNKKWSLYGWKVLIKRSKVSLYDNDSTGENRIKSYLDFFGPESVAKSNKVTPLLHYNISLQAPEFDSLVTKFYQVFGGHMKSLDISECVDLELDHSDQSSLTSLEHFSFRLNEVQLPFEPGFILKGPRPSLKIFMSTPHDEDEVFENLGEFLSRHRETLSILHFDDEHSLWYERSPAKLVRNIVEAGFKKLKTLDIPGEFDNEGLDLLASGNIKCEELVIQFNAKSIPSEYTFQAFFSSQSKCLKQLRLYSTFSNSPDDTLLINNCKIPTMEKLKSFYLANAKGTLDFVNDTNFPVLEQLELLGGFQWEDKESSCEPCKSLKKLTLDRLENETKELISKLIVKIGKQFPNLTELFVFSASFGILNNEHIELIKSNLPSIKKLTLTPSGIRDFDNLPPGSIREEVKLTF